MLLLLKILFFLSVGFICGSFFKPILYFLLHLKGIFTEDKNDDIYFLNQAWCWVSGVISVISMVFCAMDGANVFFTVGCIIGMLFPFIWYYFYFKTANGKASLLNAKIRIVKKKIKQLKTLDLTDYQKIKIEDLEDEIKKTKEEIADIYIKDFNKDIQNVRKNAGLD